MHALHASVCNTSNIKPEIDKINIYNILMDVIQIFDKANLKKKLIVLQIQHLPNGLNPSINPSVCSVAFLSVPSDSFLISMVASCDTPTVYHPLLLPLSQPGCLMSEGLVIYRVTS